MNQREYSGDLTEEQLTRLLQEAYEEEIPALSEELLQKTLQQVKMTEQASQKQNSVSTSFVTKWVSNVMVKRYALVGAMCILLLVCGKMVKENGAFVKKESAPESYDMASAKNEASGSMYFNDVTSNNVGIMADSSQSITEENGVAEEECADGFLQAETGTTDTSAAERVEEEAENILEQNGSGTTNTEKIEQAEKEKFGEDSTDGAMEKESVYERLEVLLPEFPKELYTAESCYELWIDGGQVENGWESYLEHALRYSPMEPLVLQKEQMDGMTEVDILPADTFFQKGDILFTLIVSSEEITYCMEVGACTKVTIEQNGEKRSTFFTILDLTLYEEILTIKS